MIYEILAVPINEEGYMTSDIDRSYFISPENISNAEFVNSAYGDRYCYYYLLLSMASGDRFLIRRSNCIYEGAKTSPVFKRLCDKWSDMESLRADYECDWANDK